MIDRNDIPAKPEARAHPSRRGVLVFLVACVVFGSRLPAEPHFVDESAYVAQSYYADLLLQGRRDDPAWLEYPAYDLPPLAKYLVGFALRLGGFARPGTSASAAWYENTSRRFETDASLTAARIPSVLLGAAGCVALWSIAANAFGGSAGLVAAALLMASPLYRLHARRAMSDVPAEACLLVALAFGLVSWSRWVGGKGGSRAAVGMILGAGVFAGLSVLAKLNGAIACMILGTWAFLGVLLDRVPARSKLGLAASTLGAVAVAFGTFVALNPFLTAKPPGPIRADLEGVAAAGFLERVDAVRRHRVEVSRRGQEIFPRDALTTPTAKLAAVAVQGYGRFSPLGPSHSDSTKRYDVSQDWGVVLWAPLVIAGAVVCVRRGMVQRRSGLPPIAWAVGVGALVALAAVTAFIPLAWDRYYLSIQPGAILLASAALTTPSALRRREPA